MGLAHAAMPNDRWFLDLLVSAAAGGAVYVGPLLAVGTVTDGARRRGPAHPSPAAPDWLRDDRALVSGRVGRLALGSPAGQLVLDVRQDDQPVLQIRVSDRL